MKLKLKLCSNIEWNYTPEYAIISFDEDRLKEDVRKIREFLNSTCHDKVTSCYYFHLEGFLDEDNLPCETGYRVSPPDLKVTKYSVTVRIPLKYSNKEMWSSIDMNNLDQQSI